MNQIYYYDSHLYLDSYTIIYKQLQSIAINNFFIKFKQFIFAFIFFQKASRPWIYLASLTDEKRKRKARNIFIAVYRPHLQKLSEWLDLINQPTLNVSTMKKTGNPVKLLNVKEDNRQYLINQTTTLLQMSNSDVTFTSTPSSSSSDSDT